MQSGYQPECERFNILIHLWPFLLIVAGEHSKISVLYIEFCVFCFSLCKKNVELSVHNIQICCWLVMLFVSHSFDWINLIISCAYASGRNKKKLKKKWCDVCVYCVRSIVKRDDKTCNILFIYILELNIVLCVCPLTWFIMFTDLVVGRQRAFILFIFIFVFISLYLHKERKW